MRSSLVYLIHQPESYQKDLAKVPILWYPQDIEREYFVSELAPGHTAWAPRQGRTVYLPQLTPEEQVKVRSMGQKYMDQYPEDTPGYNMGAALIQALNQVFPGS